MSLKKYDSSLSDSLSISTTFESINSPIVSSKTLLKSKSSSSLSTSLCDNFIDLTMTLSESSDIEISKIDLDNLIPITADKFDNVKTYNFFTKNLCINEIRYSPIPIEYLPTSLKSIAIVYNISNWNDYNVAFSDIQYNMGDSGKNKIIECEYLGYKVNKLVRICTDAKVYEFVSSELKEIQHIEVNKDLDFYKFNQPVDLQTSKEAKTHA
ncbi:14019_t:CDS:2 [Cetraspora pellucida]|uniref:14019_t:CDS:1 n=1 Tax=Cetraspora pellucida TaxID=1433469 RepID=A0A9N9F4S6_9GLOM|nr:14019_t:CDS:2 [Cetraspora pellucida]